ncbi:MAG: SDR family NAD(P)-dependent oxidoreductase [Deltaproteobacteria bacterium]|nr:MAG: SDR family NAD(P)-dependent oxidoreductase [Deltaproteobacteria bacterium]
MSFYHGKKVLIVGGSQGIGRALAVQLASQSASVYVAARGQQALDETVELMKQAGGAGVVGSVSFDVTDRDAVNAASAQVLEALGGLDVLICNSGFAQAELFSKADPSDFDRMMAVNFHGHVNVVRSFVDHFIGQGHGDICLVSSMMGFLPLFGYSAYSASKFAIIGFGESLRQELKLHGVRVTMYYPPTTETPGLARENESKPAAVWKLEADNSFSKTYTAEQVAQSMARCIERGVVHGMIGADSKLIYTLNRLLPGLARSLTDGEVKSAVKKAQTEAPPR